MSDFEDFRVREGGVYATPEHTCRFTVLLSGDTYGCEYAGCSSVEVRR